MIHLTDSALNAVRNAIKGASDPVEGLRLKVETGSEGTPGAVGPGVR